MNLSRRAFTQWALGFIAAPLAASAEVHRPDSLPPIGLGYEPAKMRGTPPQSEVLYTSPSHCKGPSDRYQRVSVDITYGSPSPAMMRLEGASSTAGPWHTIKQAPLPDQRRNGCFIVPGTEDPVWRQG